MSSSLSAAALSLIAMPPPPPPAAPQERASYAPTYAPVPSYAPAPSYAPPPAPAPAPPVLTEVVEPYPGSGSVAELPEPRTELPEHATWQPSVSALAELAQLADPEPVLPAPPVELVLDPVGCTAARTVLPEHVPSDWLSWTFVAIAGFLVFVVGMGLGAVTGPVV